MNYKTISYDKIDEKLYEYTHSSGLKVYVLPKKGYYKKFAAFATNYGSNDSEFFIPGEQEALVVPDGIAHFLEHKLFEQKDGNVMDKYAELGASPNAYTSFNQTVYWFTCTEQFSECFELLLDYVQNPYITEESVEREKGIIGQEINMYQDDPGWKVYFNLLNAFYQAHPTRKDIAGTIESISHINKDILYKCYKTFYHPSNMVIVAGGDIDHEDVFKRVDKMLAITAPNEEIRRVYPTEPQEIHKELMEQKMEVSIPLFYMGYKESFSKIHGKDILFREVAMKIIFEMLLGRSSALYSTLYAQGLVDDSFGFDYTLEKDYGYSMIGGESKHPEMVKDAILAEVRKFMDAGFEEENFVRTKKMMKGRFVRNLNSVEKVCKSFIGLYFKEVNVFDYFDVYDSITYEYAFEVFKEHFEESKLAMSIVRPLNE